MTLISFVFCSSIIILLYIYLGYPLLLWVANALFLSRHNKRFIDSGISIILIAYNEEKYVGQKIKNILELDYPKDKLEIIIASDGSNDTTAKIVMHYEERGIKTYIFNERRGKAVVLGKIVPEAKGEIIVLTDARQILAKDAIKELIANFADPKIGCVSGELILGGEEESGMAKSVGLYWNYEKWMRKTESDIYSMIGATGAIYAIRKKLFVAPPPDTILDDVYIPLQIVKQGYRAIFDPAAKAFDTASSVSKDEFKRKVRTLAGNFQLFVRCQEMFNPFKSKVAWQFFSHKFLRAFGFLFLAVLFISSFNLRHFYPYRLFFLLQAVFYGMAFIGSLLEGINWKVKIFDIPYAFCVLNFAALIGFIKFITGKQKAAWDKAGGAEIK